MCIQADLFSDKLDLQKPREFNILHNFFIKWLETGLKVIYQIDRKLLTSMELSLVLVTLRYQFYKAVYWALFYSCVLLMTSIYLLHFLLLCLLTILLVQNPDLILMILY